MEGKEEGVSGGEVDGGEFGDERGRTSHMVSLYSMRL